MGTLGAINERLEPMLQKRFPKDSVATSYAVSYKNRNNSSIGREDIYTLVRGTIFPPHKVDLDNPEVLIVVEIVKVFDISTSIME